MHIDKSGDAAKRLNVRLTGVTLLLGLSVATNGALALTAFTARQVVLVPTLPAQTVLSDHGKVPMTYLEQVARDVVYLFLNRTPESSAYFEQQVLKIAEPKTYQAIRIALQDQRRDLKDQHVSQTFHPQDWYLDPGRLYAEVSGTLQRSNGTSVLANDPKTYALRFSRHGASLLLSSLVEIKPQDAVGLKNKTIINIEEPL